MKEINKYWVTEIKIFKKVNEFKEKDRRKMALWTKLNSFCQNIPYVHGVRRHAVPVCRTIPDCTPSLASVTLRLPHPVVHTLLILCSVHSVSVSDTQCQCQCTHSSLFLTELDFGMEVTWGPGVFFLPVPLYRLVATLPPPSVLLCPNSVRSLAFSLGHSHPPLGRIASGPWLQVDYIH